MQVQVLPDAPHYQQVMEIEDSLTPKGSRQGSRTFRRVSNEFSRFQRQLVRPRPWSSRDSAAESNCPSASEHGAGTPGQAVPERRKDGSTFNHGQPPGNAWNENRNIAPLTANWATTTGSAATPWKANTRATTPAPSNHHEQRQVGSTPASRVSRLA